MKIKIPEIFIYIELHYNIIIDKKLLCNMYNWVCKQFVPYLQKVTKS